MATKIISASFNGIDGEVVYVEVDINKGLPSFSIVGLPDISVKESKERVRSAIINSGFKFPLGRVVINLAPADIKKIGTLLDLPIAVAILLESGQIVMADTSKYMLVGELSLSGEVKAVNGCLPIIIEGKNHRINNYIIPEQNVEETMLIKNNNIFTFANLKQVADFLIYEDQYPIKLTKYEKITSNHNIKENFSDVFGNESAKRALEIAAASNHNIILYGPAGSGKTMLARRLPSILPDLSYEECLEVTKIYSVSGNLKDKSGVISYRPFRNPHHTTPKNTLIGGGRELTIGEISLAHRGVLFLDELLEFDRRILECLREPLEDKVIRISRLSGKVSYPADFIFISAMNTCPCGKSNGIDGGSCICTDIEKHKYRKRLSKAIADRIDLYVQVAQVPFDQLMKETKRESSEIIKERVEKARKIQKDRYSELGILFNSQLDHSDIKKYIKLDCACISLLEQIYDKYHISTRGLDKILKVSRTIADLNNQQDINKATIVEALNYRKFFDGEII
ncbi:YifB family Mg chelatase-like AAA ATPase [Clostridium manihotivorum]|uniref:Magnesium chelatase n=1 Tax=Clostridium manihotivorum TaxID=2320868 RepID=A0A410DVX1_9CLOT|nr:YifB family Mg chelatase-like AAA ATPase [Clostridium manihotivorum]QAA33225.1 magnesium chelatase [Clostridium manihotivorum]